MAYAKTSERRDKRLLREEMRSMGLSYREIAAEFARRYPLRPRAAWREAYGWSLQDAADRINSFRGDTGLDPGGLAAMTSSHLSEYEKWPGYGPEPAGRRPNPYLLAVLASIYDCAVTDLVDLADRQHLRPADLLILDKYSQPVAEPSKVFRAADPSPNLRHDRNAAAPCLSLTVRERPVVRRPPDLVDSDSEDLLSSSVSGGGQESLGSNARPDPFRDDGDAGTFGRMVRASWPDVSLSSPVPDQGMDWLARLPTGRALDVAGTVAVQVHPMKTAADGRGYLPLAGGRRLDRLATASQRGLLVGVDAPAQGPMRLFGVDLREAHRAITESPGVPSAIPVPQSYELDDLTYGIIWALVSLDDALLADDGSLDQQHREFLRHERLPLPMAGPNADAGLTSAGRMWLGSSFCARHILRNLASSPERPVFWTREQTGEEACAWLLFRHKHRYLKQISGQFGGAADPLVRGFCVPEHAVAASEPWERILLFLSVALMESMGIRVKICKEPEYAQVDGFVLLPGNRAIIATWVRSGGVWHADCVTRGSAIRDFASVAGHASAHSVTAAATPAQRSMELAEYLGLDWRWLRRRCEDLGRSGCAGLIRPRSRLLSTEAMDSALRFVGTLDDDAASR